MEIETADRYCDICGAKVETPVDTLAGLSAAPRLIAEALRSARPGTREGWSPSAVAAHLADAEVVFGWRLRQTLAEEEPELQPFDQDHWAAALWYETRDPSASLRAYAAVIDGNVALLRTLDDAGWERRYCQPEYGVMSLRKLAQHESDHDVAHLRQIQASGAP